MSSNPPKKKTLKSQSVNNLFKQISSSTKQSQTPSPTSTASNTLSGGRGVSPMHLENGVKTLSLSSSSAKLHVISSVSQSKTPISKSPTASSPVWKHSKSPEVPAWGMSSNAAAATSAYEDLKVEQKESEKQTDIKFKDSSTPVSKSSSKFDFQTSTSFGSFNWADADDDEEFGKSLWADIKNSLDKQHSTYPPESLSASASAPLPQTASNTETTPKSVWNVLDPKPHDKRSASASSALETEDDPRWQGRTHSNSNDSKVRSPFDSINERGYIFEDPSRYNGSIDTLNRELFNPSNGRFEVLKSKRSAHPDRHSVPFGNPANVPALLTRHSTSNTESTLWNESDTPPRIGRSTSASGSSKFFRNTEQQAKSFTPTSASSVGASAAAATSPLWFTKDSSGAPDFSGSGFNSPNSSSSSSMARMSRFFPSPITEQRTVFDSNPSDMSSLTFNIFSSPQTKPTGMGIMTQPPPMRLDAKKPDHLVTHSADIPKSSIEQENPEQELVLAVPRMTKAASYFSKDSPKHQVIHYIKTVIDRTHYSESEPQLVTYIASLPTDAEHDVHELVKRAFSTCDGEIVSVTDSTHEEGGKDGFARYRVTAKLRTYNSHRPNLPSKMTPFVNSVTGEDEKMLLFITGEFPNLPPPKKLRDTINDVSSYPEGFSSTFHRRGINNFMFVRELQSKMIITKTRGTELAEFRVSIPEMSASMIGDTDEFRRHKRSFVVTIDLRELENRPFSRDKPPRLSDRKRGSYKPYHGNANYRKK